MKFHIKGIRRQWLSGGIAAILCAAFGWILFYCNLGGGITRLSFDFPFAFRGDRSADDARLIYMDEISHEKLNQPLTAPWDRSLHAALIDRLTQEGAKTIVF